MVGRTEYSVLKWEEVQPVGEVVEPVVVWVVARLVGAAEGDPPKAGGRPPKPPTQWKQMRRRGRGRPEQEPAGSPLKMMCQIHNRPVWHQKNVKT